MKKIYSILTVCLICLIMPVFTGCIEQAELVEDLELSACLTPSSTSMSIDRADGTTVTFTWANSRGASRYEIQIFEGDEMDLPETVFGGTPLYTEYAQAGESGASTSYTRTLEADKFYFARVKAQNIADDGRTKVSEDSKWAAFPSPIATYVVKPEVSDIVVTERTSTTITLSWQMPEGDDQVNQIRVTPNPDPADPRDYGVYEFPSDMVVTPGGTVEFTVGSTLALEPSTQYTLAVHYGSANRGEVVVWTRPDWANAQTAANTEEFRQLISELGTPSGDPAADAEPKAIRLTNTDEDYLMGEISLNGPVVIFGDQTEDGKSPVVAGTFYVRAATDQTVGCNYLRLEALNLEGGMIGETECVNCIDINKENIGEAVSVDVEVLNCNISSYGNSVIYCNKEVSFGDILFDGCFFEEIGPGQDGFDFRKARSIESLVIRNSTHANSYKGMVRVDNAPTAVGKLVFDNNTLYKAGQASYDKGLFYVRASVSSFALTDNLVMSTDIALFTNVLPTDISSNFYYKIGETAWAPEGSGDSQVNAGGKGKLTQSEALSGKGAILTSDPCVNSERGVFNIKPESTIVLDAGAGDPRWLVGYVPEEVPDLTPVPYNTVWNLSDTDIFYDEIEDSTVRGNIGFFITANPIKVTEDGMEFTAEAAVTPEGTPSDCAMGFLVDKPGSAVLSTMVSRSGSENDHISVAFGPADKSAKATVEGAVMAGANGAKVAFPIVEKPMMVYIYACGPIVLTDLTWIEDVSTGGPSILDTPSNLTFSAASAGDETSSVTLSWDAVSGAAIYKVVVSGPVPGEATVSENRYEFAPSSLTTGTYTFTVQALKAENDQLHEDSEVSDPVTFEKTETLEAVPSNALTTWGSEDLQYLFDTKAAGSDKTEITADFVYNNLYYIAGSGGKLKFGHDMTKAGTEAPRVQLGGTGKPGTKQCLQFIASGSGTLTVEVASGGDSDRQMGIYVNETPFGATDEGAKTGYLAPKKGTSEIHEIPVTANAGDMINIVSMSSGINIFSVSWTPEGFDPNAGIPFDETAINEPYDVDFTDAAKFDAGLGKFTTNLVIDKVTYGSNEKKQMSFSNKETEGVKFGGASDVGDNGIPENRYVMFRTTKPGTVGYKSVTSSTGVTSGRELTIILVKYNDEGIQEIIKLVDAETVQDKEPDPVMKTVEITADHLADTRKTAEVYIYPSKGSSNLPDWYFIPAE